MKWILSVICSFCLPLHAANIVICEGDSLTAGFAATPTSNYVNQMYLPLIWGAYSTNLGLTGDKIADNTAAFDTLRNLTNATAYTKKTVCLLMFINDIAQNDSVSTITTNLSIWAANVRGAFPEVKIMALTQFDSSLNGTQTGRVMSVNAWIRTNTPVWDYVSDLAIDSRLDDHTDTTYFHTDGVHLTDAGYAVMATVVRSNLQFFNRLDGPSHYVRAGASGAANGSTWSNAWTTFGAIGTKVRGDTYYVAGGTYTENPTIAGGAGSTYLTFKKANTTDNGSDLTWSSSYESTLAKIVGAVSLEDGNVELNGVTGSDTNSHGILITNSAISAVITLEAGTSNYRIIGCDIRGTNMTTLNSFDGIYWNNASNQKGLYVERCWLHEISRNAVLMNDVSGTTFTDYGANFLSNVVMRTGNVQNGDHGQGFQIALESRFIRWERNKLYNIIGSAHIAFLGIATSFHHDHRIVNNVFYNTESATFTISPGVIWSHADATGCSNIYIANNTFYNIGSVAEPNAKSQIFLETVGATNNSIVNNLWETCNMTAANFGVSTNLNNGFYACTGNGATSTTGSTNQQIVGSASAMVSPLTGDYSLAYYSYASWNGRDTTDTITQDYIGDTRTAPVSIGAFEGAPFVAITLNPTPGRPKKLKAAK